MSTRLRFYCFILIFFNFSLFSQEASNLLEEKLPTQSADQAQIETPNFSKEQLERFGLMKKTLQYGITKERVGVLKRIKSLNKNEASYFLGDIKYILTEEKNWRLQINAIQAVNTLKLENFEDEMIQLLESPIYEVQQQVIMSLQSIKSEKSIPKLINLLEKQDFSINSNLTILIIQALSELKTGNQAYGFLVDQLKQTYNDTTVRNQILLYLSKITLEDKKSLQPVLVDIFQDETETIITRGYSVYTLGKLKLKDSIPLLKEFLDKINNSKDRNFVRKSHILKVRIVSALSDMGDENLYSLLIDMAKDDDEAVRARAIKALGEMENLDEESRSLLKYKSENDPSGKIRKVAKKIVQKIEEESLKEFSKNDESQLAANEIDQMSQSKKEPEEQFIEENES